MITFVLAFRRYLLTGSAILLLVAFGGWGALVQTQEIGQGPKFVLDSSFPKPLPSITDAEGNLRSMVSGMVGSHCLDLHDHIIQFNRGYLNPKEYDTPRTAVAPPIIEFDPQGNVVHTWGDPSLSPVGMSAVLPHNTHGCYVDYEDNIWMGGNADGIVQKWTHDGKKMLLQIGTRGLCDAPPTVSPKSPYPTCGAPGNNSSRTLLNEPADIAVDPKPDPVSGQRGSIYIADGYGNFRVVVFDRTGKFLRQFGTPGTGPGQFYPTGAGHPHCVNLSKDDLVYACDRPGNRILVFDRLGNFKRTIPVIPPATSALGDVKLQYSVADIALSPDPQQKYIYVAYAGCACPSPEGSRIYILGRESGAVLGRIGGPGPEPGNFLSLHSIGVDSKGNIYTGEGRVDRIQRFLKVSD